MIKILLINSDEKLNQMHSSYLSKHFSVDSARDGLLGLRQIRLLRPQAVVSAYDLPRLSGLSLLKFVRSHRELSMIPFLFLADQQDDGAAMSLGANELLLRAATEPAALADKIYYHLKLNPHAL